MPAPLVSARRASFVLLHPPDVFLALSAVETEFAAIEFVLEPAKPVILLVR
jgi:hypothetical protein